MSHVDLVSKYLEVVSIGAEKVGLPVETLRALDRATSDFIRNSGQKYRLHHDFETYCDVSVVDVGADIYSRHPSCEVLMLAYAVNDEAIDQWVPAEGQVMPRSLDEMLRDPNCVKFAWNKGFEWSIFQHVLKRYIPHDQWRDPMVLAFSLSLPGKLDKCGEVIRLPEDQQKKKRGPVLIRKFCAPVKPTKARPWTRNLPHHAKAEWEEFKDYNRTDVVAEREIYSRICDFDMPQEEWDLWVIDQEINQAGIPINMRLVDNAIKVFEHIQNEALEEAAFWTGQANPNSRKQFLPWVKNNGYPFDDLKAGHVSRGATRCTFQLREAGIDEDQEEARLEEMRQNKIATDDFGIERPADVAIILKRALEMRVIFSQTSPSKYYKLVDCVDQSGEVPLLRNALQFCGAGRTWRWSGRMFQIQNLPRPATAFLEKNIAMAAEHLETLPAPAIRILYDDPIDVLTTCIRPSVQAPEGYTLGDADLNAIENRVLGWITGCRKILEVFEKGRDPYIDFATYLYDRPYHELWAEYKAGDKSKRTIAKPGVLGCGYMLGAGEQFEDPDTGEIEGSGLLGYAWNMGVKSFTLEDSKLSVDTFRSTYGEVKDGWYGLERAMKAAIRTQRPQSFHMIEFDYKAPFLRMVLPSGRALHYLRPRLEEKLTPWNEMKETITYEGYNKKKFWTRISTHPGMIMENADQAIARDLLAHGIKIAKREYKLDLRFHVHDQNIILSPEDKAERQLELLIEAMERQPHWAPGLPLGSEGFNSRIFMKD